MTTKQDLYRDTSAADDGLIEFDEDGAEVVWLNDKPKASWLDDFDFDDYTEAEPTNRIGGLWQRYGGSAMDKNAGQAERIVAAQRLVQGFVDTFATGDLRYEVSFSEAIKTAGTDFSARKVYVSHRPLFDPRLTPDEANTILTAMGCHEASHVRYGRKTADAAKPIIRRDSRAAALSNILDDYRIERRFAADYPGFENIFAPTIKYVAESEIGVGQLLDPARVDGVGLAGAAIRYDDFVAWTPETQGEREWWQAWAVRWSQTDKGSDHAKGLQEGLAHLDAVQTPPPPPPQPQPGKGQQQPGNDGESGESGESTEPESDEQQKQSPLPSCVADGIDHAAYTHTNAQVVTAYDAQREVLDAKMLVKDDETGSWGQIFGSSKGRIYGRGYVRPNGSASAAIRAAFARSRTGHFGTERGMKSGRIDNRSLARIASNDHRLFAKRSAPSEDRYLVWLLVDCSGSMAGYPIQDAASVSASIAAAVRFLPNITLDIWGWKTAQHHIATFSATRVYHSGEEIANIGALINNVGGGTPDLEVLSWAAKAIRAAAPRGVKPVIIMASDGEGSIAWHLETRPVVKDLSSKHDVQIVSVALGGISPDFQRTAYGANGFIKWAGSITAMAKPLGDLIARIATGHGTR